MICTVLLLVSFALLMAWGFLLGKDMVFHKTLWDYIGAISLFVFLILFVVLLAESCGTDGKVVSRNTTNIDIICYNTNGIEYVIGDEYKSANRPSVVYDSENGSYLEEIVTKGGLYQLEDTKYVFHLEKEN